MKHFVAYHNYERMEEENKRYLGEEDEDGDQDDKKNRNITKSSPRFGFLTRKDPVRFQGHVLWWIQGQDKPRDYYLCGWFIVDGHEKTERDRFASHLQGTKGVSIRKGIYLNDEPWFSAFRKANSNFSLGVQPIADPFIKHLLALVRKAGHPVPSTDQPPPNPAEGQNLLKDADRETPESTGLIVGIQSSGPTTPERQLVIEERIIRDSTLILEVKRLHNYRCQVCGKQLNTPAGLYAEGAHIRPLGSGHDGPDAIDNILCLCPNHHVMFDYGVFSIRDDLRLLGRLKGKLRVAQGHPISREHLRNHRERFGIVEVTS